MNNYKDNLNSLYRHPDLTLTVDKALRNVIVSAYSHYINSWPMNGACVGHCTVLMKSMLQFAMHYGSYGCRQCYLITQCRRKGLPPSMPLPAIDLAALLTDEEENLKPEQMNVMHVSVMDLLGNPSNPLYTEPHSMAKHFDAMTAGAHAIGDLPGQTCCRDDDVTAHIYKDEARQVCQKILRYLDMRVMDGDLIVPTCLRMPTLILPDASRKCTMIQMPRDSTPLSSQPEVKASCNLEEILGHPSCPGTFTCSPPMCERLLTSISTEKNWREGRTWMRKST